MSKVKSGFITAKPHPQDPGVPYMTLDYGEQIAVSIKPAMTRGADSLRDAINAGDTVMLVAKKGMPADLRVGTLKPSYKIIDQVPIDDHPLMNNMYSALAIEITVAMAMQRWDSWKRGSIHIFEGDTPDEELIS